MEDNFILTIIQSGITGAGLIFAAYGITIAFSEKLKEFRVRRSEELRQKLDKDKPVQELKSLTEEIEASEATPMYFSWFVVASFLLFLLSAILGVFYMTSNNPSQTLRGATYSCFLIATILFGITGLSLLNDFIDFMKDYLESKAPKKAKGKKK